MIDKREMQYLYRDGADYVFMDNETYDQLHVGAGVARRRRPTTCIEGETADPADVRRRDRRRRPPGVGRAHRHRDRARRPGRPRLGRPQAGHAGDRARSCRCRCSSTSGDRLKVDTRSGEYITRA